MEGEQGWVMQGVLSRASFRRSPVSGQTFSTVLSLHICNIYAKKKGIAKKLILTIRALMIGQQIDVVAGDFNGTPWRCSNTDNISTIDEAQDLPDQIMEGEQGWVLQGVLSRAIFRCPAVSGQKYFTVFSQHISNIYAKKKGIAKKLTLTLRAIMISPQVDYSSWWQVISMALRGVCRSRNNLSTIDEAFTDCAFPTPLGPHTIVETWIHSGQLGKRLRISPTTSF